MYLCEEYMRRHSINVPYMKHVDAGCVFFKYAEKERWSLLNLKWHPPTYHPGHYRIQFLQPIHNGYKTHILFETICDRKVHLDEYEDFLLNWRDDVHVVAKGKREIKLAAWEVCLCCYDSLLSDFASRQDFLKTIDSDLSEAVRITSLEKVIEDLSRDYDAFASAWRHDMERYLKVYSNWLANLVRKNV